MRAASAAAWNRTTAALGRVSMYRLVLLALGALALVAFVLSFFALVAPTPVEIVVTAAVLVAVCVGVDAAAQRVARLPHRFESSLITAAILLFVLRPTLDPTGLAGIALAAAVGVLSKYLLVWRRRHVFNPAAVGATALTLVTALTGAFALGSSSWWVGTPALAPAVLLLGLIVLVRTERVRTVGLFWVVAVSVAVLRTVVQLREAGLAVDLGAILGNQLWSSPLLFLGAFMLSEPLTTPPRRWQRVLVAAAVGALAGWPIATGVISLGQERALLLGNLLAFAFCTRSAVRLTLESRARLTPTVQELTFRARGLRTFEAGQYLELTVPHRRPDARGTRREFSIVSAPEDLPTVRVAFRERRAASAHAPARQSTYKAALLGTATGDTLHATGVWGDFVLPRRADRPILMVAAGIGVTPFVSQLRHLRHVGADRDVVLVYVAGTAAELAFREEIAATRVPVIVSTRDEPADLPEHWTWMNGDRLDAAGLVRLVDDLDRRDAYVSGPPALVAELAPALGRAASVTTDAFSGY